MKPKKLQIGYRSHSAFNKNVDTFLYGSEISKDLKLVNNTKELNDKYDHYEAKFFRDIGHELSILSESLQEKGFKDIDLLYCNDITI